MVVLVIGIILEKNVDFRFFFRSKLNELARKKIENNPSLYLCRFEIPACNEIFFWQNFCPIFVSTAMCVWASRPRLVFFWWLSMKFQNELVILCVCVTRWHFEPWRIFKCVLSHKNFSWSTRIEKNELRKWKNWVNFNSTEKKKHRTIDWFEMALQREYFHC